MPRDDDDVVYAVLEQEGTDDVTRDEPYLDVIQ